MLSTDFKLFPQDLLELIEWNHEDVVWIAYDSHSEWCYTVFVLTEDEPLIVWRAVKSLNQRWTLSPLS